MGKQIYVYVDLQGEVYLVGTLWVHANNAGESASFEYAPEWRRSPSKFSLEPALELGEGSFHTDAGKSLFGSIGDSAPDRWGRVLMKRREARTAKAEDRNPRLIHDSDYLLMVNDFSRQGALRFAATKDGPFLATAADESIPPVVDLGRLLNASERIQARQELDQDIKDLVDPGASLGGARPKASVIDTNGDLLIAKFPSRNDDWDVELWEYLSFKMAERAGIPTPTTRLEKVNDKNVLILNRFDRREKEVRIPFLSAMSMLGYSDGDHGSYLELSDILAQYGAETTLDQKDLWRRVVFNIMISNVDDHLRNHGFLYEGSAGWRLSPIYDLEPTPTHEKPRVLHTYIDLYDGTASLDVAYSVADEFGLDLDESRKIAKKVAEATRNWASEAARLGASKADIETMSSAFDHDDLKQGLKAKVVK
ncbi:MAG: type II toxin-antitoxin system HipA family toxin [Pseudodesulfovibrio sp.]|nr:type II toxin-antitoxin system HipA family toxin [Pseudodesulfovibrio sp.]